MPRLTAELVASSPQFMNPLKERELDLRGNSIPAIENLGAARVRCMPACFAVGFMYFHASLHLLSILFPLALNPSRRINLTVSISLIMRFDDWKTFPACLA